MTMAQALESATQDCETVVRAAQLLDISEYELFLRAYGCWYPDTPDEWRIDELFAAFMFDNAVPFWVRDFARKVLQATRRDSAPATLTFADRVRFAWKLIARPDAAPRDDPRTDFELPA